MGLFASREIMAGEELTFDYQLDCLGKDLCDPWRMEQNYLVSCHVTLVSLLRVRLFLTSSFESCFASVSPIEAFRDI